MEQSHRRSWLVKESSGHAEKEALAIKCDPWIFFRYHQLGRVDLGNWSWGASVDWGDEWQTRETQAALSSTDYLDHVCSAN